jgi:hypothetical protein
MGVLARDFRAADARHKVVPAMPQAAWFGFSPGGPDIFHEAGFFQKAALAGIDARGSAVPRCPR